MDDRIPITCLETIVYAQFVGIGGSFSSNSALQIEEQISRINSSLPPALMFSASRI